MKNIRLHMAAALLILSTAVWAGIPASINGKEMPSLAPLVEEVSPAVVNIRVSQVVSQRNPLGDDAFRRFFGLPDAPPGRSREVASAGSGVIVDAENGYILTNHHVVENADEIQISLRDGQVFDAEIVGSDPATDIAVIKVDADGLKEMPIGDSDEVRVGDFVLAIGNPFGLSHTVTSGIVSALGRMGISRDGYEDFIQTDASINPGNSGGALVNMRGELVGINSAIISRTGGNVGIGFAVPSEIAQSIMRQLLDFGEIRRGLLGVSIQSVDAEAARALNTLNTDVTSGAVITSVESGSAAEKAGLELGDIIIGVNDEKIDGAAKLRNTIGLMRSGDEVDITFIRDGDRRNATTALGQQQIVQTVGAAIHPGLVGAQFANGSVTAAGTGVEVISVEAGSPAAQRDLRAGDVIKAVNRRAVRNLAELNERAEGQTILFLLVQRGDRSLMLQFR
ncbi:MAG: DegQ family serine endoprotease [Woeseiaceae bacterium]|nr:DegQ family serine endoprotease [Woeseiaceae bacterium]